MQSLQICMYTFVLRAEVLTTFGSKVVIFSARLIQKYTKFANSYIFLISQHFATKLCNNFTNLEMLLLAVMVDSVLHAWIKI